MARIKPYYHEGDTAYPSFRMACSTARRLDREKDREHFVIREAGVLRVTDTRALATFYSGTKDEDILFCSRG